MKKRGKPGGERGAESDAHLADGVDELADVYALRRDLLAAIASPKIRRQQFALEMAVLEAGAQLVQFCYEGIFDLADLVRLVADTAQRNGYENALERTLEIWELDPESDARLQSLVKAAPVKGRPHGTPAQKRPRRPRVDRSDEDSIWQLDGNGKIRPNEANALKALELLKVELSFDRFRRESRIDGLEGYGPTLDEDAQSEIYLAIQRNYFFKVAAEDLKKIIRSAARRNSHDPITDFLDASQWDGMERIDEWLITYGGARDDIYVREVGRKMLLAAVRRARHPGAKFDYLPILEGPEGVGKSTVLKILAGEDFFTDSIPLHSGNPRHTIESMRGIWVAEYGELAGLQKADVETVKAWLSRSVDSAALKWEKDATGIPRRFIAVGTTNPQANGFLNSTTGNRRFWPVVVQGFDLDAVKRDRAQLWAEAAYWEAKGETLELSKEARAIAAMEQDAREMQDEWVGTVSDWLDGKVGFEQEKFFVTVQQVATECLHLDMNQITPAAQQRIANALRRCGLTSRMKKVRGRWYWGYPIPR